MRREADAIVYKDLMLHFGMEEALFGTIGIIHAEITEQQPHLDCGGAAISSRFLTLEMSIALY